jgi:hypothetical protein
MTAAEVAIATITLVRSPDDAEARREDIEALAAAGAPVAVADGGSPDEFVRSIEAIAGVSVIRSAGGGLIGQARESLGRARAHGAGWLLYTEPDKRDFFATHLADFLDRAALSEDTGIVLASRSSSSFETFPPVQQYTETVANRLCRDATHLHADFMYGPFLLHPRLLRFLDDLPSSVGWGWRPFLFGLAPRLGLRVTRVEGHYICPPGQRLPDEAERLHRMRQLSQNIDGLVRAAQVGLNPEREDRDEGA